MPCPCTGLCLGLGRAGHGLPQVWGRLLLSGEVRTWVKPPLVPAPAPQPPLSTLVLLRPSASSPASLSSSLLLLTRGLDSGLEADRCVDTA